MNYNSPLTLISDQNLVATESSSMEEFSRFAPVEADRGAILKLPTQEDRFKPLSQEEQEKRHRLESKIKQTVSDAYCQLGKLLAQIREQHLYRSTHGKRFDDYCQDTFGFGRRHGDNLIQFASVTDNLKSMSTNRSQNQLDASTISACIEPTNLEQTKALASLNTAEEQWQVWNKAIEAANGKVPTGALVKKIVAQHKQEDVAQDKRQPPVLTQDDCQVDDVFTLVRLEGEDKKYNGCVATVTELTDSTVTVDVYDATITGKLENLNKIASSDDKPKLLQTLKRIRRIRGKVESLEPIAKVFLKNLSKRTNLTRFEENFLSFLEDFYGVDKWKSKL